MITEYTPEFDLEVSRAKLQRIVDTQVEVPDETLFQSILDILASRGGERWQSLDELWLYTKARIAVVVGLREEYEGEYKQVTYMGTRDNIGTTRGYQVSKRAADGSDVYELNNVNAKTSELNAVNNHGNLGTARLLSILADAHMNTPLEDLPPDAYEA